MGPHAASAAWPLLATLLAALLQAAGSSRLQPRRVPPTSLLDGGQRRWNWKTASEETKTEWGIVIKRYVMFDMTLLQLEHLWDEALPSIAVGTTGGEQKVDDESLARIQAKVTKLRSNLDKAILDQNTSDSTADDMQRDIRTNSLTKAEKHTLQEEHRREKYGFFSVEASAQDVYSQASALLQAMSDRSRKPSESWASILPAPTVYPRLLANAAEPRAAAAATRRGNGSINGSAAAAPPPADPMAALLVKYREAVKAFRTDLGSFQNMQQKAWTGLLAVSHTAL